MNTPSTAGGLLSPTFGHQPERSSNNSLLITPEPFPDSASTNSELTFGGGVGNSSSAVSTSNYDTTTNASSSSSVATSSINKQKKIFKTEYKSKFTPFNQYAYNEATDSFVKTNHISQQQQQHQSIPSISASKSNQDLSSSNPSPSLLVNESQNLATSNSPHSLLTTHEAGVFGVGNTSEHATNPSNEPWYKEVVKRNEKANEYRFKSEIGHNSPLLNYNPSSRAQSPFIHTEHPLLSPSGAPNSVCSGAESGGAAGDVVSNSAEDAKQQYRFTPNDYKRDHLIAHMANNNNFKLPKEQVDSEGKPTSAESRRTQGSANARLTNRTGAQLRSRSQSTRRQPHVVSSSANGITNKTSSTTTTQTKSNQTTPTRTVSARTPTTASSRLTTSTTSAASKTTTRITPTSRTGTTRTPTTTRDTTSASNNSTGTKRTPTVNSTQKDAPKRVPVSLRSTPKVTTNGTTATTPSSASRLTSTSGANPIKKTTTSTTRHTPTGRTTATTQRTPVSSSAKSAISTGRLPNTPKTTSKPASKSSTLTNTTTTTTAATTTTTPSGATTKVKSIKTPKAIAAEKEASAAAAIAAAAGGVVTAATVATTAAPTTTTVNPETEEIVTTSTVKSEANAPLNVVNPVETNTFYDEPQYKHDESTNLITTTTEGGNMLADELAHAERAANEASKLNYEYEQQQQQLQQQSYLQQVIEPKQSQETLNLAETVVESSQELVDNDKYVTRDEQRQDVVEEGELVNGLAGGLISAEDRFDSSERETSSELNDNVVEPQYNIHSFSQPPQQHDSNYDDEPYSIMPTHANETKGETFVVESYIEAEKVDNEVPQQHTDSNKDFETFAFDEPRSEKEVAQEKELAKNENEHELEMAQFGSKSDNEHNSLSSSSSESENITTSQHLDLQDKQQPLQGLDHVDDEVNAQLKKNLDIHDFIEQPINENDSKESAQKEFDYSEIIGESKLSEDTHEELTYKLDPGNIVEQTPVDQFKNEEEKTPLPLAEEQDPVVEEEIRVHSDTNEVQHILARTESVNDDHDKDSSSSSAGSSSDSEDVPCIESSPALVSANSTVHEVDSGVPAATNDNPITASHSQDDLGLVQEALYKTTPQNALDEVAEETNVLSSHDDQQVSSVQHHDNNVVENLSDNEDDYDVNKSELLMNVSDLIDVEKRKKQEMVRKSELARQNSSPQHALPPTEILLSAEQLTNLTSENFKQDLSDPIHSDDMPAEKPDVQTGTSPRALDSELESSVINHPLNLEANLTQEDYQPELAKVVDDLINEEQSSSSSEEETDVCGKDDTSSKTDAMPINEYDDKGPIDADEQLKLRDHLTNRDEQHIAEPRNYNYNPLTNASQFNESSSTHLLEKEDLIDGKVDLEDGSTAALENPTLVENRVELSSKVPEISHSSYMFSREPNQDSDEDEINDENNIFDVAATIGNNVMTSDSSADNLMNLNEGQDEANQERKLEESVIDHQEPNLIESVVLKDLMTQETVQISSKEENPHGELFKELSKSPEERKNSTSIDEVTLRKKKSISSESSSGSSSRLSLEKVQYDNNLKNEYEEFVAKMTADIVTAKGDNNNTQSTNTILSDDYPTGIEGSGSEKVVVQLPDKPVEKNSGDLLD